MIFLYGKVDFEEEHHIQRSYFLEWQLRALESWNLVAYGSAALNQPGAERWRKVAAQPGGRLQMQLGQAASPGWRFSLEHRGKAGLRSKRYKEQRKDEKSVEFNSRCIQKKHPSTTNII
jgi:hypothetical protein